MSLADYLKKYQSLDGQASAAEARGGSRLPVASDYKDSGSKGGLGVKKVKKKKKAKQQKSTSAVGGLVVVDDDAVWHKREEDDDEEEDDVVRARERGCDSLHSVQCTAVREMGSFQ